MKVDRPPPALLSWTARDSPRQESIVWTWPFEVALTSTHQLAAISALPARPLRLEAADAAWLLWLGATGARGGARSMGACGKEPAGGPQIPSAQPWVAGAGL